LGIIIIEQIENLRQTQKRTIPPEIIDHRKQIKLLKIIHHLSEIINLQKLIHRLSGIIHRRNHIHHQSGIIQHPEVIHRQEQIIRLEQLLLLETVAVTALAGEGDN
jgi:hypothetical protein